ncbi:ATP-binding cassette sub-family C member 8-like [Pollicipes pollicipes]|uniref:ATP-binding cassette sub-family C member 8-like n=1 Tax=Pollicipes pollicipes TaxID=41117 RepID=UPI0018852455|nr:ATP-binding cassette sub-family C member 8-like [Pollicipes pollicipes]
MASETRSYLLGRFYRTFAIELQRLDHIARAPVLSHLAETQAGLSVVRAYGHQKRFFATLLQCVDLHLLTSLVYESGQRWLGIALDYLGAVIVFVSSVSAVTVAVTSRERVPSALIGLAINYTLLIPTYLVWVVRSLSVVEMYMCAVERVHKYTMLKAEDYRKKALVAPDWPRQGKIEFIGASVGYSVALVGRSGSGKSTLAMALFQMSDLLEGVIRIDGMDLKSVPLHSIRSQVALIPQEPLLFSGTVRSNLDPKFDIQDEEIWRALELVQMKEYIKKLGKGLESEVQEGGDNFSPTSSLDAETERKVQAIVWKAFEKSTVITIAHQLTTVLDYDQLLADRRDSLLGRPHSPPLRCPYD